MVMDTVQIRMNKELIKRIDKLIKKGFYSNRAEVIRDAVRRFMWEKEVGSIEYIGPSVELIREARKQLGKEITSYEDLEKLNDFK